jgi:hypothetical protein
MRPPATLALAIGLAAVMLLAAACSDGDRPTASDWEQIWTDTTDELPTLLQLGDPPNRDLCSHALGALRSSRPNLFPTPDAALDGVVTEWVTVAEDAMFECPPSSHGIPDLASAYDELARLGAEVDVVLEIDLAD